MMLYGDQNFGKSSFDNGPLPDGTKPLPQPMLTLGY